MKLFDELLESVVEAGAIGHGKMKPPHIVKAKRRHGMHAEQFKIVNLENNEELASVGS